jgi:hypothetical protein
MRFKISDTGERPRRHGDYARSLHVLPGLETKGCDWKLLVRDLIHRTRRNQNRRHRDPSQGRQKYHPHYSFDHSHVVEMHRSSRSSCPGY